MVSSYIPKRGDIIWLNFSPQAGHEQSGKRPAIVLSPESYNEKVGLILASPITSQIKGYPFEVELSNQGKIKGVILSDHVKNLDWKVRNAKFIETAPEEIIVQVLKKLNLLLSLN